MTGQTKNFNQQKAYGYIKGEDDKDYFFHKEDFLGGYNELVFDHYNKVDGGIEVTFIPANTEKGLRARNVIRMDTMKDR